MSDIKVPGIGPVKKGYIVAAAGVTAGILAYAYWRRRQTPAPSAAADTSPTTATDPSTGLPYGDASAGVGYGQPGYGGYGGAAPYGSNIYGEVLPAPTGLPNNNPGGVYTTNHDWYVAAVADLQTGGFTEATAALAVSNVLGGLSVTSDQRAIFLRAVGLLGQPPQGYPTPIKVLDPGTGPATPPASGGGSSGTPGAGLQAPAGVHAQTIGRTTVTLAWSPVPGAIGYRVYQAGFGADVGEAQGTSQVVHNLRPNTIYHFYLRSMGSDGAASHAASHTVTVHTKK